MSEIEWENKEIVLTLNCNFPKDTSKKWIEDYLQFCLGTNIQIDQSKDNPLRGLEVGECVSDITKMVVKRKKKNNS